jgi:hypothetical protein
MQTPIRTNMLIRLNKRSIVRGATSCEKNGSAPSVTALLSLVEIVNWGKFNRLYLSVV